MTYATVADMVARFGEDAMIQMTDRQQTGEVNQAAAQLALEDATAEINGYLGRYSLPFKEIPPILTRVCCDIARYRLCSSPDVLTSDDVINKYRIDAINLLKSLANGLVTLGVKTDGEQVDTGDVVAFSAGAARIFGRGK